MRGVLLIVMMLATQLRAGHTDKYEICSPKDFLELLPVICKDAFIFKGEGREGRDMDEIFDDALDSDLESTGWYQRRVGWKRGFERVIPASYVHECCFKSCTVSYLSKACTSWVMTLR